MTCACLERIEQVARARAGDARRRVEHELPERLRVFSEAMVQGAVELVARHLVRAGTYRASLDDDGSKDVPTERVLSAIARVVGGHPDLQDFLSQYGREVQGQLDFVDARALLRGPTWKRAGVSERLGGLLGSEIREAETLAGRLDLLRERLPTWTALARSGVAPRVERILDPHESREP